MVFIGDRNNLSLSEGISSELKLPVLYPEIVVFPDGEREVLVSEVANQEVVVLRSYSSKQSVNSFIVETALVLQALKKAGASKITAIVPYIPYSRSEIFITSLIASFWEEAGLSSVIFIDPHTQNLADAFSIETKSLSTAQLFSETINRLESKECTLISPDKGGAVRVGQISKLTNLPFIALSKTRRAEGEVTIEPITQKLKGTCIIIDDMITTGSTIEKASMRLREAGAVGVYVIATHGIFTKKPQDILGIDKIIVTDSVAMIENLETVSIAPLIAQSLSNGG